MDEADCGAACVATVARYYGKRVPITKIRNIAGTDSQGTSGTGIVRSASHLNFSCKAFISKEKVLKSDYKYPLIAHINRDGLEHYIVILRTKKNKVLVADPALQTGWILKSDFLQWWSGIFFSLAPQKSFTKTNEERSFFSRYIYLLRENKVITIESFIASFLLTLLGILGAFYFRYLIDDVIYSYLKNALIAISLGYFLTIIFQNILSFARNHLLMYLSNKMEASLLLDYIRHILHLPLDFFTKRKSGEILSRLSDISSVKNALSNMTIGILLDCVMLIFVGIVLFAFSSRLVFIAIIPVMLSGLLVIIFSKKFHRLIYKRSVIEAEKYSHFVESINGISTLKALCSEDDAFDKAELKIIDSIQKSFELGTLQNVQSSIHSFLSQVGNLAIYWYGAALIMNGELSLGELISFVTLLGYFLGPLSRLITLQPQLQELSVAGKRLGEIIDLEEEQTNGSKFLIQKADVSGKIEIKNLSFSYGTRGNTLEKLNLKIEEGEKVAFVGLSGSGKTTLMKLILKFYTPGKGEILIDGKNVLDFDTKSYRNLFGYVPQEILLFSGTIYENIAWGNYDATPEQVFNAAKSAHALDFIENLEDRFETKIGEKGASLSGGERQRIALARVLLKNPKILILDEATSHLDALSENSIMQTINNLPQKTTTLIVAHRLSAIKNCDKIFVMKDGKIEEQGSHCSLLEKKGLYRQMWKNQNEK